ncbi:hypothetical protein HZB02_02485 [Candidatus Woesearchaeota archaeon]|nr:hypothetical protein [Candidatus Woesearchaeota archaeon]
MTTKKEFGRNVGKKWFLILLITILVGTCPQVIFAKANTFVDPRIEKELSIKQKIQVVVSLKEVDEETHLEKLRVVLVND